MLPKVAFVCVHNACRSQIAEALGKSLASDVWESYSAGTHTKPCIDPDAVRLLREECGIDMTETQSPKLLDAIPPVDVVITMGCNVQCPYLPCRLREDWGIQDPTGQGDDAYRQAIQQIRCKVLELRRRLLQDHPFPEA